MFNAVGERTISHGPVSAFSAAYNSIRFYGRRLNRSASLVTISTLLCSSFVQKSCLLVTVSRVDRRLS